MLDAVSEATLWLGAVVRRGNWQMPFFYVTHAESLMGALAFADLLNSYCIFLIFGIKWSTMWHVFFPICGNAPLLYCQSTRSFAFTV